MDVTTDPAPRVHRFEPKRAAAKRETMAAALFAFAMVLATLYARGERDWRVILAAAVGGAAVVLLGFAARAGTQWTDAIELSPEGITLVRNGRPKTLAWTAVKSIRHDTQGGEHWLLVTHGRDPLLVRDDGLTRAEAAALRELIPALHVAARRGAGAAP